MVVGAPLLAVVAVVSAGSSGALIKVSRCNQRTTVLLLNVWTGIGVCLASAPLWILCEQSFTLRNLLLGAASGVSTAAYFWAVGHLGLTVASALTCGIGWLVSSICSIQVQNQPLQHRSIGAAAVFLIVLSLAGTAMTGRYNMFILGEAAEAAELAIDSDDESEILEELHSRELAEQRVMDPLNGQKNERAPAFSLGLSAGVAAGMVGGCAVGLTALPDQAAGALGFLLASLLMAMVGFFNGTTDLRSAAFETTPRGIASGIALFAGNLCRLLSADRAGLAVFTDAILSTTVLIAGAWGIAYYREMTPRMLPACLISGIGLVAGGTMLAVASRL